MPAEQAGLERARAVESWIARVRLVAVVFAVLEVEETADRGSVLTLELPLVRD